MRNFIGATLLEVMLALAIASAIVVLGLRQYYALQDAKDLQVVKRIVDELFQAASAYYKANCMANRDYFSNARLAPFDSPNPEAPFDATNSTYPQSPLVITDAIGTLVTPGYLAASTPRTKAIRNYSIQFNRAPVVARTRDGNSMGQIYFWKIQISALPRDTSKAAAYANLLAATCTSSVVGNYIQPCTPTSSGDWIVWERLPSLSMANDQSILWSSTPRLNQFKQQYTNDSYYEFENAVWNPTANNTIYYQCGG